MPLGAVPPGASAYRAVVLSFALGSGLAEALLASRLSLRLLWLRVCGRRSKSTTSQVSSDDPRRARFDADNVVGASLTLGSVVHHDSPATGKHVGGVRRLAAFGLPQRPGENERVRLPSGHA
jgi:hypothetical protein